MAQPQLLPHGMPVALTAGKDLFFARGSVLQVDAVNLKNLGEGEGVPFFYNRATPMGLENVPAAGPRNVQPAPKAFVGPAPFQAQPLCRSRSLARPGSKRTLTGLVSGNVYDDLNTLIGGWGCPFSTIVPPRWGWKMFLPKDPATRNSHLFSHPASPHLFFTPRTAIGPISLFLGDSMKELQQPCVNY
ncbi:hypothetical protein BA6E_102271 [Bacteroidales bacterium 6E]|nr:hypothetical protein BA6E_102271 [Bacteroidales bacterium 6E]